MNQCDCGNRVQKLTTVIRQLMAASEEMQQFATAYSYEMSRRAARADKPNVARDLLLRARNESARRVVSLYNKVYNMYATDLASMVSNLDYRVKQAEEFLEPPEDAGGEMESEGPLTNDGTGGMPNDPGMQAS